MTFLPINRKNIVVCGHFGSGKTNVSVNMALEFRKTLPVTLVDLDIVNPFYGSSDNAEALRERGVRVITPGFAGTNVEGMTLRGEMLSAFEAEGAAVFDAGGDDAGALILRQYRERLAGNSALIAVVNFLRPETADVPGALGMIREIERASGLECAYIINNTNLGLETTPGLIRDYFPLSERLAEGAGAPLYATTVLKKHLPCFDPKEIDTYQVCGIDIYTKTVYNIGS